MRRARWLLLALLLPCATALSSDWKYAGYLTTRGLGPSIFFFDAASVTREGPRVRYWVKTIPRKSLDIYPGPGSKQQAEFVKASAEKIASGYVPPLLTVSSVREWYQGDFTDFLVAAVGWDIAANKGVRHTSRFLFEIDCGQMTIRTVEGTTFDKKGDPKPSGPVSKEWDYIAPDTNAAWLSEVLCRK